MIDDPVFVNLLCISEAIVSYDAPVMKVVDLKYNHHMVKAVDSSIVLLKYRMHPLSFVEAFSLKMEHNAKWREICADCLSNELMNKTDVLKKLFGEYRHTDEKDRNKTDKPKEMTSIIDLFREQSELFNKFAEVICSTKFEPVKEEVSLPGEIDLYNFFEQWGGYAKCYRRFGTKAFCHTLKAYFEKYQESERIEYYIGDNRYYAIKFKGCGVFLVSEKRYQELKEKKGE